MLVSVFAFFESIMKFVYKHCLTSAAVVAYYKLEGMAHLQE